MSISSKLSIRLKVFILFIFSTQYVYAQDSVYARKIVDTLTSRYFWGRGYTCNGMAKASAFLVKEFKRLQLVPLNGKSFTQTFSYPVNTFPGKLQISIDGVTLTPGQDFLIGADSRGVTGTFQLIRQDSTHFYDVNKRVFVVLQDKLTWTVSQKQSNYTIIYINSKSLNKCPEAIQIKAKAKLLTTFTATNVCAMVKGTVQPDSFLVITAHYDHLGGMGRKTYFPGANDNVSGISQLLSLASYYAEHPQLYSIVFLCFAGEEAGLLGSKYFTEHPLIALPNIHFLLNIDLAGTGDEGITVVNATLHPKEFTLLEQLNTAKSYFSKIISRGKAANSDHYWFTEKGVPAFFIYTMGGIKAYHDIYDSYKTLPLTKYESLFLLIHDFINALMAPY